MALLVVCIFYGSIAGVLEMTIRLRAFEYLHSAIPTYTDINFSYIKCALTIHAQLQCYLCTCTCAQ